MSYLDNKFFVLSGAYQWHLRFSKRLKSTSLRHLIDFLLLIYSFIFGLPIYAITKVKSRLLKTKQKKYGVSIVAIGKNEGEYILEWIAFHKVTGIDHIYLYDNDSSDDALEKIKPFIDCGFVTLNKLHGEHQQFVAYNHALKEYGAECKWMAFIDCDEFLMPEEYGKSIEEELESIASFDRSIGGIAVNWCMYGSSGHEKKPDGMLTECFLMRAKTYGGRGNECIKTIARPECIKIYQQAHHPRYKLGYFATDTRGQVVPEWKTEKIESYKSLRINHYFTKSKEQWIKRRALGKADLGEANKRSIDEFFAHDNNDEKDLHALHYSDQVRKCIEKLNIT